MNKHEHYQELISRLLDEDTSLTAEENAALQAHLAECAECTAMYEAFSALSGFVGGELEEPPESLRENVMAEIRREEIRRRNRRAFGWTGFAAAAAVLALVVGFAPRGLQREAESPVLAAQASGGVIYEEPAAAPEEAAPQQRAVNRTEDSIVSMDTTQAAAAESADENPEFDWDEGALEENAEYERDYLPEENAEDRIAMDDLLMTLSGIPVEMDLDELQLSPVYMIDTDGGVLEIYRYNGALYFSDPLTGTPCRAGCSETALILFLQG